MFYQNPWKENRQQDFVVSEIERVAAVNHKNIMQLQGFCLEGKSPLLVYNKFHSLHKALYEDKYNDPLNWDARYKIALGVAKGLAYLHSEARSPMLHSGIKPSNILFDPATFDAYIGDFGLAQLLTHSQIENYSDKNVDLYRAFNISGYWAPEVEYAGKHLSAKTDVYSFGKLLYALISSKKDVEIMPSSLIRSKDTCKGYRLYIEKFSKLIVYLFPWIRVLFQRSKLKEMNPMMQNEVKQTPRRILQASTTLRLIVLCTQSNDEARPAMDRVAMEMESANLCNIPRSVKAALAIGFGVARGLACMTYAVIVSMVLVFFGYVSYKMIPLLDGPRGILVIIYHVVIVILVLHLTMVRMWSAVNGMDELLYWSPDDDLRLGWKRYHRLT
eukprot:Gb_41506 [translate_table: standard]